MPLIKQGFNSSLSPKALKTKYFMCHTHWLRGQYYESISTMASIPTECGEQGQLEDGTNQGSYLGVNPIAISRQEQARWKKWVIDFALQDFYFKIPGKPFFMWVNLRIERMNSNGEVINPPQRAHKRLDIFPILTAFGDAGYSTSVRCLTSQVMSDHIPMCLKLTAPTTTRRIILLNEY